MTPRYVLRNVEIEACEVFGVPKLTIRAAPHPPIFINVGEEHAGRAVLDALGELAMTFGIDEEREDV